MNGVRTGNWAIIAVCAALALGSGCKKKEQTAPVAPPSPATVEAPSTPAANQAAALSRIPADALAIAVASGPKELLAKLGRAEVVAALGDTYTKAAAMVALEMGRDLMDPGTWAEIGIDASGPVGIVWLGMEEETGAAFVSVSDAAKLRRYLEDYGAKLHDELQVLVPGDPVVLRPSREQDLAFVIASDSAFLVFGDHGREETEQAARRIASQKKEGSLAAAPAFTGALDQLAFGSDVTLWLDTPSVVSKVRGLMMPASELNDLTRRRDEAKAAGDAEEAARLTEQLAEELKWAEQSKNRREGEAALLEAAFGGLGPIAIGGQIEGPALRLKATSPLKKGSVLARGLRNGAGSPTLLRALSGPPLVAFAGTVDPAVALEFTRLLARADGDDLDDGLRELKQETGIDAATDVLPTLSGEAGFALTGRPDEIMAAHGREFERAIGFTATFGVKDEEALRASLVKLWASRAFASIASVDKPNGSARLAIPEWRDVHVAIVDKTLVVTTDPDAFGRVQKGGRGAWLDAEGNAALGAAIGAEGPAAMMIYDNRMMGMVFMALDFGDWAESGVSAPENPSPEWNKALAAYKAAKKEEAQLRDKVDALELKLIDAALGGIGFTVASARVAGDRLDFTGAQVVGGASVPAAAAEAARQLAEGIPLLEEHNKKRWEASERAQELRSKLTYLAEPDDGGAGHERDLDPGPMDAIKEIQAP